MTRERVFRVLTPVLLGATLVMMLRGDQVLALALAVVFFVVYVASVPRAPKRAPAEPSEPEE